MTLILTAVILLICVGLVVLLMDRSPFDPMIRWLVIALAVVGAVILLLSRAGLV